MFNDLDTNELPVLICVYVLLNIILNNNLFGPTPKWVGVQHVQQWVILLILLVHVYCIVDDLHVHVDVLSIPYMQPSIAAVLYVSIIFQARGVLVL